MQRRRGSCGGQSSRGGAGQLPCGPAQDKNQETKFGRFRMLAVASAQEPRYRFREYTVLLSRATEDIISSLRRAVHAVVQEAVPATAGRADAPYVSVSGLSRLICEVRHE